jgi:hypothetical protein
MNSLANSLAVSSSMCFDAFCVPAYAWGAALGGDENDAVRASCAVDRRGGGVLQDVDCLDVVRVDLIEVGTDDAVHDDERLVAAVQRVATSNADAHLRARLRVGRLHDDARRESRDRLVDARDGHRRDVVA